MVSSSPTASSASPLVVLTGASGGLGRRIIGPLLEAGYRVAAVAGRHASQLGDMVKGADGPVQVYACDLEDPAGRERLHAEVLERQGHPDVFIGNAGVNVNGMCWKVGLDEWRRVMAVNVEANFHLSQLCIPGMRAQGRGRIVYISSVMAVSPVAGAAPYAASKAALLGLMRSQSVELASKGITVNAVAPGYLAAGMLDEVPPQLRQDILGRIPMGRFGTPEELASLLLWLIGPDAAYMTGQTIHINGGLHG